MIEYVPEPMPLSLPVDLQEYLFRELTRISMSVRALNEGLTFSPAIPTIGLHRVGDIVFNDGSVTSIASVDHWRCTVGGTPGTWITK